MILTRTKKGLSLIKVLLPFVIAMHLFSPGRSGREEITPQQNHVVEQLWRVDRVEPSKKRDTPRLPLITNERIFVKGLAVKNRDKYQRAYFAPALIGARLNLLSNTDSLLVSFQSKLFYSSPSVLFTPGRSPPAHS
jgi:hypothetical protein